MKIETNKEKGNTGLSLAIAYYGSNGYTVSIPLNDTQDYDLIVDNGIKLQKVQVKFTNYIPAKYPDCYEVSLRSCGGTKGTVYKTIKNTNVDIVFIVCGDCTLYEIPKDFISNSSSLTLRKNKNGDSNMGYSQFIVTI